MKDYFYTLLFAEPSVAVKEAAQKFLIIEFSILFVFGMILPSTNWYLQEWAIQLTEWVAVIIPQIDSFNDIGIEPDINRFYYSILWVIAPVTSIALFKYFSLIYTADDPTFKHFSLTTLLGSFSMVVICIYLGFFLPFDGFSSRTARAIFGSRIGRSIMGQLFCLGVLNSFLYYFVIYKLSKTGEVIINLRKWSE